MQGHKILITGGAGCLGNALAKNLSRNNKVVVYSRNEEKQFLMNNALNSPNITYCIGDIRDYETLSQALWGCDIAIHAAAMKDLIVCEDQPTAAYLNNIEGSKNFIEVVKKSTVKKAIAVSTDKAAAPSNLYGMTKYIMERLFIEANKSSDVMFNAVRFGNMIDSTGSLIPYWKHHSDVDVKLTHPEMERFFFKVSDAVDAVITTLEKGKQGEIFIPKMKKAKIIDILRIIKQRDSFEIIGLFPGEKIYEDLISENESMYCSDEGDYYVIRPGVFNPAHPDIFSTRNAKPFSKQELIELINVL